MVSIIDAEYPSQLKEIGDPPSVLFIKGNLSLLNHVIAIIGTRHSSELGNKIAERVGSYFADYFSICNGLVEGIDEHSIYVGSKVLSNVVGIISGGLCYNETCSSHHIQVINDVLEAGGLIISEYYPRQKEDMYSGSKASRIQAGLSHGLILVQSKIDGGSKYTLAKFAKLGRPIGVIHFPSSAEYQSESFGANRLIAEKGKDGLAQMIGLKKTSSINIGPLIVLSNKDDYNKLIQSMSIANNNVLF
jgi:DNA processing protein